ncbi:diguanylate cyclase (GGDEF) domain-containing protein [Quadrisphaera granulorum]|uniref:Diguanylate cyclase (GGDEF)-like protein n=1 Tax=Quadrisphaera granulorum TaxID=317664 RepID=A0A316AC56_9ACTN|nr:GGDEF domain-containing protein [Quadrisphaera granulorum]PWJ55162.1 diguanylate cyclase (GGDEF)-like protein [Quadrisphaera granulorum]SZE95671.1 diguanylate cyclase (GGDEF) domain-containing protein [Quadrisphaera granulorum]
MTSRAATRGRRRSGDRRSLRPWLLAALPVLLVAFTHPGVALLGLPTTLGTALVGLTEAAVAATAAVLSGRRARRERTGGKPGRHAVGWWLLAAAAGSWAAGQLTWITSTSLLQLELPVPSVADIGFLSFGVLAPVAVMMVSGGAVRTTTRVRGLLDGVITAGALFLLSWTLVLDVVLRQGSSSVFALVTTAAYPVADIITLTTAITVLARTRSHRALVGIAAGVAILATGDSLFVYLSAVGQVETGGVIDVLWTAAFAVVAASCGLAGPSAASDPLEGRSLRGAVALRVLPYLPFAVATVVVVIEATRRPLSGLTLALLVVLMALVFLRQALVVVDNAGLTRELQDRTAALAHMAYTDPLTGVANRAAFTAALEDGLSSGAPLVTAFCDLDSFKAVNDVCGHATGDALLVAVAARLCDVVRDGDIVARLGGDEFAILVRNKDDERPSRAADALRARLATALSVPFSVEPELAVAAGDSRAREVLEAVSVSLGVVSTAELGDPTAEKLLHAADQRMYAAKRTRQPTRQTTR